MRSTENIIHIILSSYLSKVSIFFQQLAFVALFPHFWMTHVLLDVAYVFCNTEILAKLFEHSHFGILVSHLQKELEFELRTILRLELVWL